MKNFGGHIFSDNFVKKKFFENFYFGINFKILIPKCFLLLNLLTKMKIKPKMRFITKNPILKLFCQR